MAPAKKEPNINLSSNGISEVGIARKYTAMPINAIQPEILSNNMYKIYL